jgi:hypothetical protein
MLVSKPNSAERETEAVIADDGEHVAHTAAQVTGACKIT